MARFIMGDTIQTKIGKIIFSKELIANIAGIAAIECYGLVGMASRKLKDGITEILGRDNLARGVEVNTDEGQLCIDLYVIVGYGTKIPEVALNVMEKVKYTIEKITGLKVAKVNVNIQGVKGEGR